MSTRQTQSDPKGRNKTSPTGKLPIGLRSAKLVRDGAKTAVIVPTTEQPWLVRAQFGDTVTMPIGAKRTGFLTVRMTGCCYHQGIAEIPSCELGHDPAAIDPAADWHTILCKAQWGGTSPVATEVIEQRGSQGWFVVDFDLVGLPGAWRQQQVTARAHQHPPVTPDTPHRFDEVTSLQVESVPVLISA